MSSNKLLKAKWCDSDNHFKYSYFQEFNNWIDNAEDDEALAIIDEFNIGGFSNPSKAFYAGDYEGYEQGFKNFVSRC